MEKFDARQYEDAVRVVDKWEFWKWKGDNDELPKKLNTLLFTIGHERFVSRFEENCDPTLNDAEEYILDIEEERRNRLYDSVCKRKVLYDWTIQGRTYRTGIVFSNQYISELAHYLLEDDSLDIGIVVNLTTRMAAVRTRDKGMDLRSVVAPLGGGGYDRAAGFPIRLDKVISFIDGCLSTDRR
jgi:nanoRNase/pAp phosphatase (c-di-AMP/oligoRNAs hydrolase)